MSSEEVKLILQRLGNIETGVMNLGTRLEALENKVEERLQDTRPMWEGVHTQVVELREEMRQGQEKTASELRLLRKAFSRSYSDLLITQEEHEEKLEKLEGKQQ